MCIGSGRLFEDMRKLISITETNILKSLEFILVETRKSVKIEIGETKYKIKYKTNS